MKKSFIVFSIFCISQTLPAQTNKISPDDLPIMEQLEDTLGLLGFLIINDSLPEHRFGATKKMIPTLVKALKIKNSFSYPFEQLRTVSILYPPDSTFRVFTWQLYVDVDDYRYYGAIQMNTSELKLFPLIDRSRQVESEEYDILSPDQWYGALYYNIKQFDTPNGKDYLLFGFNGYSLFNKKKLIDVLHFENGNAQFGAPVFIQEDSETGAQTIRNRIVKEYSAEGTFQMNYDATFEKIIFDHLVEMGGSYNQGLAAVPDGTYEGYILKDGKWVWEEKVFHEILEEAPRPEPILDGRKLDIFGKSN
ncbi:MAG: hypothetical protein R2788_00895 [Saprospiraceae bacterium]